jgi:choline dehydrogenase-like flavoprotein
MAIARELIGRNDRVALIESGDIGIDDDAQQLNTGEQVGIPYPSLETTRLRAFGGTTWHWGGNVKPLDPVDFEKRPGVRDSGWPLGPETLQTYYKRAQWFFNLPQEAFDKSTWQKRHGASWEFRDDAVVSQVFHTVGGDARISGIAYEEEFKKARNIDVFLNTTVVEVKADDGVRHIREIVAQTPNGQVMRFRARYFVLATGGIENARFLLLASRQQKEGLGNDHGLVGRYFQEHLTNPDFADLIPQDPYTKLGFYNGSGHDWGSAWGIMRMSDSAIRQHSLPNIRFQLSTVVNAFNENMNQPGMQSLLAFSEAGGLAVEGDLGRHVANVIGDISYIANAVYYRLAHYPNYPLKRIEMVAIGEQLPNRESRISLGSKLDRFGQRKVVMNWRLLEQDSTGLRGTARHLARAFGASGLGRLINRLPEGVFDDRPPHPHYHHMGTTRMHADPRHGVVDANSRIHRLDNFYIAGSSVFPTSGNVNPTLTIVALAIRLADHLKQRLRT